MTSATDRLRALLDERGVEWWPMHDAEAGYREDRDTEFLVYGCKHVAHEWGCRLQVDMLTPEQAVAATLGPGTCRALDGESSSGAPLQAGDYDEFWEPAGVCSECGELIPLRNYCPNCGARVIGA